MKLEMIEWIDSFGCSPEWQSIEHVKLNEPLTCVSVGKIIAEKDDYVVICPHFTKPHDDLEEQGCGDMTIPKIVIVKRTPMAPF